MSASEVQNPQALEVPDAITVRGSAAVSSSAVIGADFTNVSDALPEKANFRDVTQVQPSETGAANEDEKPQSEQPAMSKKALKRLRKQEEWEVKKKFRKEQRKARKEEQKVKRRAELSLLIAEGKVPPPPAARIEKVNHGDATPSDMKIIIDLSFDHLMNEREVKSMTTQLSRSHSANKSSLRPVEITATSKGGRLGERLDTVFTDHKNWKRFTFDTRPYKEIFSEDKLVYLTADSSNILTDLDESKAYIIGGFVDKNRHKNMTLLKAEAEGIPHAQLPIGKFIDMASRKVLAVNHVVEILMHYLQHHDWEKAFHETIPQRKLGGVDNDDG